MTVEFILVHDGGMSVDAFLNKLKDNLSICGIDAAVIPYLCANPVQVDVTLYLEGTPKDTRHRFIVSNSSKEWQINIERCIHLFKVAIDRHKEIVREKNAMKSSMLQEGILPPPYFVSIDPYHKYPDFFEMHKAEKEMAINEEVEKLLGYYRKTKTLNPVVDHYKKQLDELASKNKSKSLLNKFTDYVTESSNDLHSAAAIVTKRSRYSGCAIEGGRGEASIGHRHH